MTALVRERPEVRFAIAQQLDGRPRCSATSNDAVSVRFHPDDVERRSNWRGCRWRKGRLVAQTGDGLLPGGARERASSCGRARSSGRQRHPGPGPASCASGPGSGGALTVPNQPRRETRPTIARTAMAARPRGRRTNWLRSSITLTRHHRVRRVNSGASRRRVRTCIVDRRLATHSSSETPECVRLGSNVVSNVVRRSEFRQRRSAAAVWSMPATTQPTCARLPVRQADPVTRRSLRPLDRELVDGVLEGDHCVIGSVEGETRQVAPEIGERHDPKRWIERDLVALGCGRVDAGLRPASRRELSANYLCAA